MKIIKKIKEVFCIYSIYAHNDIKSQYTYTFDFWAQMIIWMIYSLIPFIGITILFSRFKSVGQWDIYHVGILYSIVQLSYDTSRMIGRGFDNFHKLLITGNLDIYYIRPHSIIVQIFGSQFFLRRLAGLIQYTLILVLCVGVLCKSYGIDIKMFLLYIITSYLGTFLIFLGLLIIYASTCFITIQKNSFSDIFIDSMAKIGFYPTEYLIDIIKYILIFIVPFWFSVYIPMKHLFFSHNPYDIRYFCLPVLTGCIFFFISIHIFSYLSRYYNSVNN